MAIGVSWVLGRALQAIPASVYPTQLLFTMLVDSFFKQQLGFLCIRCREAQLEWPSQWASGSLYEDANPGESR